MGFWANGFYGMIILLLLEILFTKTGTYYDLEKNEFK